MSKVPVNRLGQISKNSDTLIIPVVNSNNQPLPHSTGGANICKFYQNEVVIGLVSGQVCAKLFLFIVPMVVRALKFGGDSASRDDKNSYELMSLYWCAQKIL